MSKGLPQKKTVNDVDDVLTSSWLAFLSPTFTANNIPNISLHCITKFIVPIPRHYWNTVNSSHSQSVANLGKVAMTTDASHAEKSPSNTNTNHNINQPYYYRSVTYLLSHTPQQHVPAPNPIPTRQPNWLHLLNSTHCMYVACKMFPQCMWKILYHYKTVKL